MITITFIQTVQIVCVITPHTTRASSWACLIPSLILIFILILIRHTAPFGSLASTSLHTLREDKPRN